MNLETAVRFGCAGDELVGILHRGRAPERAVGVVVVVGGPQYRVGSHRQFVLMARSLAEAGYPVLRFDYRGMGDSTGEPRTFETVEADIRAALDCIGSHVPGMTGIVLFGLCDAASAALICAPADRRIVGLMLANPWVRTETGQARAYVRHYYGQRLLQVSFWRKLLAGGVRPIESLRGLVQSIRKARGVRAGPAREAATHFVDKMLAGLESSAVPVLILISEKDLTAREFTDLAESSLAWQSALSGKLVTIERLPGADHTFSMPDSLKLSVNTCRDWLLRHLPS